MTTKTNVYNGLAQFYFLFSFYGNDTIYRRSDTRGRGNSGIILDPGYPEAEETEENTTHSEIFKQKEK